MAYTTINKSSDFFNTKLYTGNGASSHAITGVGHKPDFTWIKARGGTQFHNLVDSVRGVTKILYANNNEVETTDTTRFTSFNSDGFTLDNDADVNGNSANFASWNWKAGTTASGNTGGSGSYKTYSSSSNSTSGVSIIKYTGNGTAGHTVPHGCGSAPTMIIFKQLNEARGWGVYHKDLGVDKIIYLDENIAPQTASPNTRFLNNTAPSSSVVSLGTWSEVNKNDASYIAYCFAEKQGYSKFGSYTGNDNSTFVYTGFKPKFLLLKNASEANGWLMLDAERTTQNPMGAYVYANTSGAEGTVTYIDFLSNGFRLVSTNSVAVNKNGNTFVYAAFGQSLVGSNNVPCTAR